MIDEALTGRFIRLLVGLGTSALYPKVVELVSREVVHAQRQRPQLTQLDLSGRGGSGRQDGRGEVFAQGWRVQECRHPSLHVVDFRFLS